MKHFILLLMMLLSSSMVWATGVDADPLLNDDGSNDPHMNGCWLLMLDRNNNEIWHEMLYDDGDYVYINRIYSYIFGCTYYYDSYFCDYTPVDNTIPSRNYRGNEDIITYDARFCFVINGVRYGPEENYKEVVFLDALSNPLVESNNYYTIMTGITVNMGVAFDKDGKAYVYCCHVGYNGEPAYNSDKDNFPDPHKIGVWLLMLDRNNNEIWHEMLYDDGDYVYINRIYSYIFGCTYYCGSYFCDYTPVDNTIPSRNYRGNEDIITYDARFCFVINGVRYGPEENYKEVVFGDALSNPLVESNNYYTIMTGITVNMGVAFDKDGKAYVYCCHVGYNGEPYYNSDKNNFPDPRQQGVWLLMLDRNNNEIWKKMTYDDGDYTCYFEPYCCIFGCTYLWHSYFCDYTPIDNNIPSRPFYGDYLGYPNYSNLIVYDARASIVIDGVRYGPEENYSETVLADAFANPLIETNNYYTIQTGYKSWFGVAFDDERNAYFYQGIGGLGTIFLFFEYNFPIPQFIAGDVNYDNEVNIADVNALISMILSGNNNSNGDMNGDGEINIADVNAVISIILGH